jgi:hypothetical protein
VRYAVAMGLESLGRQLTVEQPGLQQLREALAALARPDHESIAVVRLRATVALSRLDA